ncbi:hypothetical protein CRG98_008173 [Punica granatum]|uniref:Uncharacterized protein n=1 Tax=Punica granatum TaxID=22663 RepID=A0A2I0KUB8_PUNGR|nr:hypothetical protein CRG98_008173 [Punica granatum]
MSCKPPSCLITRPENMSVLPKWLRKGTPTISGHPVIMGPPGFHRATHRNRAGVNSHQKCLHSEKLCSGGGMTGCRRRCQCAEERPIGEPCDPDAVVPSLMKLLVDFLCGYAEKIGELTPNGCGRVGHEDALGRGRGPLDERRVLFDCGRQLRPLKVEYCMFGVPKFDGGPQEDPIHRGFGEHNHISDDALNEGAIHRSESPPNAHDILSWRCDCFEPEIGSRAVHPYLDGGDVGLTP